MSSNFTRALTSAAAIGAVALVASACGSSKNDKTLTATTDASTTASTMTGTDSTMTGTGSASGGGAAATGTTLDGVVGANDAFEISLKQGGKPVTSLKAGDYTFNISDDSNIHNFHLTGPGGVDESTKIEEKGMKTWKVTLKPGTYKYVCDPHENSMNGSFTVA